MKDSVLPEPSYLGEVRLEPPPLSGMFVSRRMEPPNRMAGDSGAPDGVTSELRGDTSAPGDAECKLCLTCTGWEKVGVEGWAGRGPCRQTCAHPFWLD